jgi:uncharacterized protein (TIGR00661 family)
MKILYGVQGTGNGHLSRARQIGPELIKLGATIDWVMSGRHPDDYFDMDEFEDYRTFQGLTFCVQQGRVQMFDTLRKLKFKQSLSDILQLNTKEYDLVISDYEPITAWAAKIQKTPSLGLAHQYSFLHPSVPRINHHWVGNALLKHFAPTQITLGLHWHHFGAPILPPIFGVESNSSETTVADTKQVVVYLPHESIEHLIPILQTQNDYQFNVFTQEVPPQQLGSVSIHALSRPHFLKILNRSAHVLCGAGFELVSEALSLGRNIMVKPLQQQTEQMANARALKLLEYATVCDTLGPTQLQQWLENGRAIRVRYPNVAQHLAKQILTGRWLTMGEDLQNLWYDCDQADTQWINRAGFDVTETTALTQ